MNIFDHFKIYLFTSAICNLLALLSAKYVYHELEGNFIDRSDFNFSIFSKNCQGIIFYGIDSQNKFLIKMEKQKVHFKFNQLESKVTNINLCGCDKCIDVYLTFVIKLHFSAVDVTCNNRSKLVIKIDQLRDSDQFKEFPVPPSYENSANTIFFWMGNIGEYEGKDKLYLPIVDQLVGCVDGFYYKNLQINIKNLKNAKNYFLPSCVIKMNETISDGKISESNQLSFKMFNCSLPVLNVRYCKRELVYKTDYDHSYQLNGQADKISAMILEWNSSFSQTSKTYALMEIQMKDESLVLFDINQNHEMTMYIRKSESLNYETVFKSKLSMDYHNILILKLKDRKKSVRISTDVGMATYFLDLVTKPSLINVGFFQHTSLVHRLNGMFNFQCDPIKCKQLRSGDFATSSHNPNPKKNSFILIFLFLILIASILIVGIIGLFNLLRKKRNSKNLESNTIQEKPDSNVNEYELPKIPELLVSPYGSVPD